MIVMNSDAVPVMRPGVLETIVAALGNPVPATSRHREGLSVSARLEEARGTIADYFGGAPSGLKFCASASEANTWALFGVRFPGGKSPDHLYVSSVEHVSVLNAASALSRERGVALHRVPSGPGGLVDLQELAREWPSGNVLVSVQRANPETGILQPVDELGRFVRDRGGIFHTDYSAAVGWETPDLQNRPFDLATLPSSALGGPSGIAALWIRRGCRMVPMIHGGAQEDGLRGGTLPVFLAEGFARAATHAGRNQESERKILADLDLRLARVVAREFSEVLRVGEGFARRPGMMNLLVPEVDGQALLSMMDGEGVIVGTGSSCSSHSLKVSHVLTALGYSARQAQGSIVLSLGWWNREEEIDSWKQVFRRAIFAMSALRGLDLVK